VPTEASYRHVLLLIAATACWGCGTVLSKQAVDRGTAPLSLLVIELAASSAVLLLGVGVMRERFSWSPELGRVAVLGLLNPGLAYALGLFGLVTISASMAVLLWAAEPVLIILLAMLLLRERVAAATVTAVVAALVGVVLVIDRPGASGDPRGAALTLIAVLCCALYAVLTRLLVLDDGTLVVVLTQQLVALGLALTLAVCFAAVGLAETGLPPDAETWVLAVASGTIYYGLAFLCFVSALRRVPAYVAGSYLPLIPVFGLTAGFVVGERLIGRQIAGAVLVVLAAAAVTLWHAAGSRTSETGL
jgi:probable blue pigment (indigoidine) exporter